MHPHHPIIGVWDELGSSIYRLLDAQGVRWTSTDAMGFWLQEKAIPLCPCMVWVGVSPGSTSLEVAARAARSSLHLIRDAGIEGVEVGIRESTAALSGRNLKYNFPADLNVITYKKPFTQMLGVPIAPLKFPYYEGTGSVFLNLGGEERKKVLLTCAHVARPPPVSKNVPFTRKETSQPSEYIIQQGSSRYKRSLQAIVDIKEHLDSISEYYQLGNTPEKERRDRLSTNLTQLSSDIEGLQIADDKNRVIGTVYHVEKIEVSSGPEGYTKDWALIEVNDD